MWVADRFSFIYRHGNTKVALSPWHVFCCEREEGFLMPRQKYLIYFNGKSVILKVTSIPMTPMIVMIMHQGLRKLWNDKHDNVMLVLKRRHFVNRLFWEGCGFRNTPSRVFNGFPNERCHFEGDVQIYEHSDYRVTERQTLRSNVGAETLLVTVGQLFREG